MKTSQWLSLGMIAGLSFYLVISSPAPAYAMHIMEGFLPVQWALFWWLLFLPCFGVGLWSLNRIVKTEPELKLLLALAGAFAFVLSALKFPSVTGSSSHPTGTGLGTILFGPWVMSVIGALVLLFQALLLAHGGLTTLGANAISMAVVGPLVAYGIYQTITKLTGQQKIAIFLAAALANLATYAVTSLQLALAFPAVDGGVWTSFLKFAGIFMITQVPLALSEGFLTLLVMNWLQAYSPEELKLLNRLPAALKES